jgi:hypothetical protein
MVEDENRRRVKGDDERSGDQADGIEEVHHLKCHESCDNRKEKDTITESPEGLIIKTFRPLLLPEENSIEEVDRGTHGAKPSTKEVSKDHHEKKDTKSWKHPEDDVLLGKKGDDPNEGVETKVEIDRNLQLKRKGGFKNQIEKETEREGLEGPPQIGNRSFHVALTFFVRTFE